VKAYKEWILEVHKDLSLNARNWVKPFLWPLVILITLICIMFIPLGVFLFLLERYFLEPMYELFKLIFTRGPDNENHL